MSSVNKLSVKGIRNFDEKNSIEISFSHPLTLIVGQNGVGKTTIIECLRYSTTGEYPPDCDRGKSFIHSIGLNEKKSINAEITAEYLDQSGNSLIVSRTIGTLRDKDGIFRLKTLDNSIFKSNKQSGKRCELTHRNADVNEEVMSFMGVSKGILNYVIFCHQDESNWPLAENKTLRECFDEIFEMKRSNKPLKALQRLYKDKQADLCAIMIEKDALFGKIRALRSDKILVDNLTTKIMNVDSRNTILKENLESLKTRLQEIKTVEREYSQLRNEELKKETEWEILKQQQKPLPSLNLLFEGTNEKLISITNSLDDYLKKNESKFLVVKNRICELLKEGRELTEQLCLKRMEIGELASQVKCNEVRIDQRNTLLKQLIRNLNPKILNFDVERQYHLGLHYAYTKIENLRSSMKVKPDEPSDSTQSRRIKTGYDDVGQKLADESRKEELLRMREMKTEYLQEQVMIMKGMKQMKRNLDIPSEELLNEYENQLDRVNVIHSAIVSFYSQNIEKKLEALTTEIESYERLRRKNNEEYSLREKQLTQINTNIPLLKKKRNDFSDILNDWNSCEALQTLERSLFEIRGRMAELKIHEISIEREKLSKRYHEIIQAMSRAEGIKEQINDSLNSLEGKSIIENYRITMKKLEEKIIEEKLIREALKELQLYTESLDLKLVKFHAGRIKLLNKCINKLWTSVYRGNDIESIQIRADTICRSNRTSFTYKLMQLRNGVEMNMRDHCSAGQRVLSSIVLRLALAETFCKDCGILSLDEPTMGLDADNSQSLAEVLCNYVLTRNKYQRNFQLIIISHDEDFIGRLNNLGHRNGCYEIYRGDNSFSRVKYFRKNDDAIKTEERIDEEDKENGGNNKIMKEREHISRIRTTEKLSTSMGGRLRI